MVDGLKIARDTFEMYAGAPTDVLHVMWNTESVAAFWLDKAAITAAFLPCENTN